MGLSKKSQGGSSRILKNGRSMKKMKIPLKYGSTCTKSYEFINKSVTNPTQVTLPADPCNLHNKFKVMSPGTKRSNNHQCTIHSLQEKVTFIAQKTMAHDICVR